MRGTKSLIGYPATEGAIHAWMYSVAQVPADRGIRVAPGPVWTPLTASTFPPPDRPAVSPRCCGN